MMTIVLGLFLALPRIARAAEKAQVAFTDGGSHVVGGASDPAQTIQLKELWRVGEEDDRDGVVFGLITDLTVDREGFVYVLDYQLSRVHVFSPDGELVSSIGREGEGPGDLRRPSSISLSPEGFLAASMGSPSRISLFRRDGQPVNTIQVPPGSDASPPTIVKMALAGDHLVSHLFDGGIRAGRESQVYYLCSLDAQGRPTTRYYSESYSFDLTQPIWEERSRAMRGRWGVAHTGAVFVASSFEDYRINVYEPHGKLRQVISRDYKHRKRSAREKDVVHAWASWNPAALLPDTRFQIEDYDKDIMSLHVTDLGECWVLTSRGFYDRPKRIGRRIRRA